MKKVLIYFYNYDLTEQSTNSIVRLTASLMKGLDNKAVFHHFCEKEDKLKLENGYAHFLKINKKMRMTRKLNNLIGRKRISWLHLKDKAVIKWAGKSCNKSYDAILLMELDKVRTVKKLFPDSKIIFWIHSVTALCKPQYLLNMDFVDHFVSPSRTTYQFLLQKIQPKPVTAVFNFMPNWCENIFFRRRPYYISALKIQLCIDDQEKVFIFCGGTQKLKGALLIEKIIEKIVSQTDQKLVFILCGLGANTGVASVGNIRIMNMGSVSPKALTDLYSIADYGLHPSLAYDHCPVSLLEMINCLVLPIVSDIGGIKEIVGEDFSYLIKEPNNVDEWACKIKEIINMNIEEQYQLKLALQQKVLQVYNRPGAISIMNEIICN